MVELAALNAEIVNDITQAAPAGQLCCQQGNKLRPTRERSELNLPGLSRFAGIVRISTYLPEAIG
jgi:hypothetical protein